MTSVWPALCPPWKRAITSARSLSQSTSLPFPSSPHWAPTTTTLAMISLHACGIPRASIAGGLAVRNRNFTPPHWTAAPRRAKTGQTDHGGARDMGFLARWVAAFGLLSVTFNPTEWNYIAWARANMGAQMPLALLLGLLLLVGYIIYLRATLRSIGGVGMGLVLAIT